MSRSEAEEALPVEVMALMERKRKGRQWLACRLATVVQSMASGKDGEPLAHWQIFPECSDH